MPALIGKGKKEILDYLRQRVVNRIHGWNNKFLSKAGREVLLKAVVQAMPTYAMNVFLLPIELCKEIEVIMNGFWWKGKAGIGIRWKDWTALSKPKSYGGLGFRRLREFNLAMLAKQSWRLFNHPESLVGKVYKARYFPKGDFLSAKIGNNPSFIWRSLFQTQDIIREGYKWRVGNGKSINIWDDPWLPDQANPMVTTASGLSQATVAMLLDESGNAWDEDILTDIFVDRDASLIRGILVSFRQVPDVRQWRWEEDGHFSVRSCYRKIVSSN
ncbi:unnamed protein product [Cuscuta epithymum]|uniref:Uncharacterized protein n=1 Tax=Cuscuta epithymum TaxID=186058 RepID=A0AAV0D589_9ASTE|nr:unnamed protein product [Cuscuta epithymum]